MTGIKNLILILNKVNHKSPDFDCLHFFALKIHTVYSKLFWLSLLQKVSVLVSLVFCSTYRDLGMRKVTITWTSLKLIHYKMIRSTLNHLIIQEQPYANCSFILSLDKLNSILTLELIIRSVCIMVGCKHPYSLPSSVPQFT